MHGIFTWLSAQGENCIKDKVQHSVAAESFRSVAAESFQMASPTLTPIYLAQNAAVTLNTVIWTFAILTLIFVVSRVYVRVYIKESFGVDDVFAVLATV